MFVGKSGWKWKIRVWVFQRGEKVLGPGRIELLGHIQRLRSISAAAKRMSMSYRRAWGLVRSMNESAGEALVEVTTGGPHGGGAALTPRGKEALALYREIVNRTTRAAAKVVGPHACI
jgi:molybdate transport system regulatory protein